MIAESYIEKSVQNKVNMKQKFFNFSLKRK